MPKTVNEAAAKSMKEIRLPSAKPGYYPQTMMPDGTFQYGEWVDGETNPGNIPMKEIPHMEFPKCIYKHPKAGWKRMLLPIDGHGNKEWQWVPVEQETRTVQSEDEMKKVLAKGWSQKPYVRGEMPEMDPSEEPVSA